jgi:NitT/TauT family transport system substrate-binding protein
MSNVAAVSKKVREEKAEALRRYVTAIIKTSRYYAERKQAWVEDMGKLRPDIKKEDLEALWDQFKNSWSVNGFMNLSLYQKTSDYLYTTDDFKDTPKIEVREWVDTQIVDSVLKEIGVYPGWDDPGRPI